MQVFRANALRASIESGVRDKQLTTGGAGRRLGLLVSFLSYLGELAAPRESAHNWIDARKGVTSL